MIFFDCETMPLPKEQLDASKPTFEPAANLKDPEKIAADLKRKEDRWYADAALDARTGAVLCVGILRPDALGKYHFRVIEGSEADVLAGVWDYYSTGNYNSVPWVGFNIKGFDIPFLVRRSWALGIPVPKKLFDGRYFSARCLDLAEVWQCFSRSETRISLDALSKFLGMGAKTGNGADFHKLWVSDKAKALEYLYNDLVLVQKCARAMSVEHWAPKQRDTDPTLEDCSTVRLPSAPKQNLIKA